MSLQTCSDVSEAAALEDSLGLYLKPIIKVKINVQLPKLNTPGQSISSWNVMEKIKAAVYPDNFLALKALKITASVIKFEGEFETKASCERALTRLRAAGSLKISGFAEKLQLRAAHAPCSGPTRHDWEAFYRDAKGVNEMKPGERPDTIHLQDIPVRWFATSGKSSEPNERILRKAFATFGRIRRLEILTGDNTKNQTTFRKKSSLCNDLLFETYIQYEEYVEFSIAMDSLRDKKLLFKDSDGKVYSANIKVDFDRTNYLSERCINKRAVESKKVNLASPAESTKQNCDLQYPKFINPPEASSSSTSQLQIEKEISSLPEKKMLKNEAKLLMKELLTRAEKSEKLKQKLSSQNSSCPDNLKSHKRKKNVSEKEKTVKKEKLSQTAKTETLLHSQNEKKKKAKLIEQERILKEKLLRNLRLRELQKIAESREKLRKELAGRKALKSVLALKTSSNSLCKKS